MLLVHILILDSNLVKIVQFHINKHCMAVDSVYHAQKDQPYPHASKVHNTAAPYLTYKCFSKLVVRKTITHLLVMNHVSHVSKVTISHQVDKQSVWIVQKNLLILAAYQVNSSQFKILFHFYVTDCHLPPFTGPCNNNFQRYFYNKTSRLCETFTFGGCNANNNNFYYQYDCENKCGGNTT